MHDGCTYGHRHRCLALRWLGKTTTGTDADMLGCRGTPSAPCEAGHRPWPRSQMAASQLAWAVRCSRQGREHCRPRLQPSGRGWPPPALENAHRLTQQAPSAYASAKGLVSERQGPRSVLLHVLAIVAGVAALQQRALWEHGEGFSSICNLTFLRRVGPHQTHGALRIHGSYK